MRGSFGIQALLVLAALGLQMAPCSAGSLNISTTTLDVVSPAAATSLQLGNSGTDAVDVQIRVFRWVQASGLEELQPTEAVVASPPFASIKPGQEFTVRIVHAAGGLAAPEESYRLLIDELPSARASSGLGVNFAVRYSIPVFFGAANRRASNLAWKSNVSGHHVVLTATNTGNRRVRLASLKLRTANGGTVAGRDGLVGYVLGGASMTWTLPLAKAGLTQGSWTLVADSDSGPIHAAIPFASGR